MAIQLQQAEALIDQYSTAVIRNDKEMKTAIMCMEGIYFRMSISHTYNSVVFTHVQSNAQTVKQLIK